MDIIKSASEALRPISESGITVQEGWYDAALGELHVTMWNMGDYEGGHSDDDVEIDIAYIQVCIWSHEDQQTLKKRIKRLMKKAGFYYMEGEDNLETDTGIFMNAMRFLLAEESETDKEE